MSFKSDFEGKTIFDAFVDAAREYGGSAIQIEDATGGSLTYKRLMIGANVLARRFKNSTQKGEAVAVLLPNSSAVVVTFLALQSIGRVPAMLNYTAGPSTILSACNTAEVRTVIASRKFVEKAELESRVRVLEDAGMTFIWLEDLRKKISIFEKLRAALTSMKPIEPTKTCEPALILYTSGSEGLPKGVVLSHENILSNCAQIRQRIEFSSSDKLFNVLPVFHSFGMTGGMVLPLVFGVKLFLYPSPLHYKVIPKAVARTTPTILFGTDTFLNGYARMASDEDFSSLRLIVAGAEAVKAETVKTWKERFDTKVLEGFGMTEAAPVVAVNTPDENRLGTVGKLLPGIEMKIEPVDGIETGGKLWLKGPNVMLGYMTADNPGVLTPPSEDWHDSGDIVEFDEDGFMAIKGRVKRFAKIAGEMVSLGAIEILVNGLWPDEDHAVVSIPDKRRGERIVLVTTFDNATREDIATATKAQGYTELMVPSSIVPVDAVPVLGSGKIDYNGAKNQASASLG